VASLGRQHGFLSVYLPKTFPTTQEAIQYGFLAGKQRIDAGVC
jgi:hypothetical protein